MGLNAEQQDAVDEPGSLVLSAGAGSGKTRVLVERYLKLLRDGHRVRNLVAITYTEKAAREMRTRIRRAVEAIAGSDAQWRLVLQDLETAAIDTIHGYCKKLLATHAPDTAKTVIDEAIGGTLRNEAVKAALQAMLLETSPVAEDLHELVVIYGWGTVVNAITGMATVPDVPGWTQFASRTPEQIAERWGKIAKAFAVKHAEYLFASSPRVAALERVKPAIRDGAVQLRGVLDALKAVRSGQHHLAAELHQRSLIGSAHRRYRMMFGDDYPLIKEGYQAIRNILKEINRSGELPPDLPAAAAVALRFTRVALAAESAYAARKSADGAIDFGDMIERTRVLLDDPNVQAAVRNEVRFVLLDEMQDTDPVQVEIVRKVLGDRFAGGGLFAVGDAKQSIYRFRGADLRQFQRLRDELPKRSLVTNYRSVGGVIRFVNTLCTAWFPGEELLKATDEESPYPAVEFHWTLLPEEIALEDARRLEASNLARRIKELIASGRCQPGEVAILFRSLSNVHLYEHALEEVGEKYYLVGGRAFYAQQEVYDLANVLKAVENPYDPLAVVATMRSPFGGLSDDAVTAIVRGAASPWESMTLNLSLAPDTEQSVVTTLRERLRTWRSIKDSLPIARLVQRVIAETEYDAALMFEPLGERKLANLWKLQEISRQFDANGYRLSEFVLHLEELVARAPREEQAATVPEHAKDVVRMMTIHQAKGLEFPVVVVPDLAAESRGTVIQGAMWHRTLGTVPSWPTAVKEEDLGFPKWAATLARAIDDAADAEELRRVLYVASTRAEKLLILSSGVPDELPVKASGPALAALAKAYDLTSGTPVSGTEKANVFLIGGSGTTQAVR